MKQYLLNSRRVEVVSRERIQGMLQLMLKEEDSRIDEIVGKEVSLRDGEIDALLTARIERDASGYRMHLRLDAPQTDKLVGAETWKASTKEDLAPLIRTQAAWVISTLRPDESNSDSMDLERVTTDSLDALRLYSKAIEEFYFLSRSHIEALARQAVAEDPEFASAYLLLARALRDQGHHYEAEEAMDKAMALKERTSLLERSFILASYHNWRGEYTKARALYETVLDYQPDHPLAFLPLTQILLNRGAWDHAAAMLVSRANRVPYNLSVQEESASILIQPRKRLDQALPLIHRAHKVLLENPDLISGHLRGSWVLSAKIWEFWLEGDIEAALSEAGRIRSILESNRERQFRLGRDASFLGYQ
jgi:tetratricopeptide (TPR) repeat protein